MSRKMFHYTLPIDGEFHTFKLTERPVAFGLIPADNADDVLFEFWAEHDDSKIGEEYSFCVFGTGNLIPDGAEWVGTCPRTNLGIWHLYEI